VFDALAVARHSHGCRLRLTLRQQGNRSSGINAEFGFAAVWSSDSSRGRRATNPEALVDFWIPLCSRDTP
jgi:hypothetical protein